MRVKEVVDAAIRMRMREIGKLGAKATNSAMTPEQRIKRAKKAARTRWAK